MTDSDGSTGRWYEGLTRYQWFVLSIACLGWIFDVFEGQIFVASMNEAMPSLVPRDAGAGDVKLYNDIAFAGFLVGGAVGGIFFGVVSDRIGRSKTLILTILVYSFFTGLSALSQTWWQMVVLRFLVAMGTGGEWAVAAALVAEVVPARARSNSLAIFHGSSIFGVLLAILAGKFIVGNEALGWRWGFAVGVVPALLTVWIRWRLREPDRWLQARAAASEGKREIVSGRFAELFSSLWRRRALLGMALAAVGLATYWGVSIYGKDVMRAAVERHELATLGDSATGVQRDALLDTLYEELKGAEMLGMFLVMLGSGVGLFSFGAVSDRLGRRGAFLLFLLGGFISSLLLFRIDAPSVGTLYVLLPIFGCFTVGGHAGYAVYFPELFPTRLRSTGSGFCFNGGRLAAASILLVRGWLQSDLGMSLEDTASLLSVLFLVGAAILYFLPETKGMELPE